MFIGKDKLLWYLHYIRVVQLYRFPTADKLVFRIVSLHRCSVGRPKLKFGGHREGCIKCDVENMFKPS